MKRTSSAIGPTIVAVAIVIAMVVVPASPAAAHANYDSSSPGRGEQLAVAPSQVEITFTQEIQKIAGSYDIAVNKDRGSNVTTGPAVVNDADRTKLSVTLMPDLADGRYVVNWKNVSDEDGDPKEGAFSFYLNHTPTAVDLANDAALEQIGAEAETPAQGETPAATESPAGTAVPGTPGSGVTPDSTAGQIDDIPEDDGGSDDNATTIVIVAVVVVAVLGAGGAVLYLRNRSA